MVCRPYTDNITVKTWKLQITPTFFIYTVAIGSSMFRLKRDSIAVQEKPKLNATLQEIPSILTHGNYVISHSFLNFAKIILLFSLEI